MFNYNDYLNFNTLEEKIRQEKVFAKTTLSEATNQILKTIHTPQKWLILAEPFCPDCVIFVPIIEKMARANSLITLRYVPRSQIDHCQLFDNVEQQTLVKKTYSIPSAFLIREKTQMVYKEFPKDLKEKMQTETENYDRLKQAYRQGEYQEMIENQLLEAMKQP